MLRDENNNTSVETKKVKKAKTRDPKALRNFLEELSWLLSSYSNIDFKAIPELIDKQDLNVFNKSRTINNYITSNPNIHFLVGILPRIFTDDQLFPSNEEIARFAENALHLNIPRWEKISRNEMIGHIVCKVPILNDENLSDLVLALSKVVSSEVKSNKLADMNKNKLDWNIIIQNLIREQ